MEIETLKRLLDEELTAFYPFYNLMIMEKIPALQHIETLQYLCACMQKAIDILYPDAQAQRLYHKRIIEENKEMECWRKRQNGKLDPSN